MNLAAFSPHLTALTYTRLPGIGWREPSSQHPQAQGKEEGEQSLTDPRSQSPALPALPALCFATRTWLPTSPRSLTPGHAKGRVARGKGVGRSTIPTLIPDIQPVLRVSPLPCLCCSLKKWLGVVALYCCGPRPAPGALRQTVWDTNCPASN